MLHRILSYVCAVMLGLLAVTGFGDVELVQAQQQPRTGSPPTGGPSGVDAVLEPVTRWFERANREYQEQVVKQLSVPTGKSAPLPERPAGTVETAGKPTQVTPREPTLLQQLQEFLGIDVAKGPAKAPGDNAASSGDRQTPADKAAADEMVRKQVEARKLEQERAAEEKRIAEEARKAKENADLATLQRQKTAEAARIAEDERRKGVKSAEEPGKAPIAQADEEQKKLAAKKADDEARRANERKEAERKDSDAKAAAERAKLSQAEDKKRQAEKEAADAKAAAEQRAKLAAAADKKRQAEKEAAAEEKKRQAEAQKLPEVLRPQPVPRQSTIGGPDSAMPSDRSKLTVPRPTSREVVRPLAGARGEKEDAGRLGEAANKAGSKAMDKRDRAAKPRPQAAFLSTYGGRSKRKSCSRAGDDISPPGTYVVKSGDTLWGISRRHYDKGSKYEKIMVANDDKISDPDRIYPCQKFFLPRRTALEWVLGRRLSANAS